MNAHRTRRRLPLWFLSHLTWGNGDKYRFEEGFFQEVMGVVPSKIHNYHTGDIVLLSESNISTYIDKIRYNYLEDGHKIRDITLFLSDKSIIAKLLDILKKADGIEVISVTDDVLERDRKVEKDTVKTDGGARAEPES